MGAMCIIRKIRLQARVLNTTKIRINKFTRYSVVIWEGKVKAFVSGQAAQSVLPHRRWQIPGFVRRIRNQSSLFLKTYKVGRNSQSGKV